MICNCDMIVASSDALFGLPEVRNGVVALAGSIPRLVQAIGRQRASEMALTGRRFTADEIWSAGLVNKVVAGSSADVMGEALRMAVDVAANSPDSVLVTRKGVEMACKMGVQEAQMKLQEVWWPRM